MARGGAEIAVFGDFGDGGKLAWFGLPQEVARRSLVLSKQTLSRSSETSRQETNKNRKPKKIWKECKELMNI